MINNNGDGMVKPVLTMVIIFIIQAVFIFCDSGTNPPVTLPAPTLQSAIGGNGEVILTWNEVIGAKTYSVFRSLNPGVTNQSHSDKGFPGAQATIRSLSNGVPYYFKVAAIAGNGGMSELSKELVATPVGNLQPPTKFTANGLDKQVILTWNPTTGASQYSVFWDTKNGVTDQSNEIKNITMVTYTHENLTNKTKYYYKIAAVDGSGTKSALSEEISGTPVVEIAIPVIKAVAGDERVTLYGKKDPYAVKINLFWDTLAGVTLQSNHIGIESWEKGYTHENLINGRTYFYRANAEDASGTTTDLSIEVTAKPDTSNAIGPKNVKVTPGKAQVVISWDQGVKDYNFIFWQTAPGVTEKSNVIGTKKDPAKSPHTHSGLISGTIYYYRVGLWSKEGWVLSKELSATPSIPRYNQ